MSKSWIFAKWLRCIAVKEEWIYAIYFTDTIAQEIAVKQCMRAPKEREREDVKDTE